MFLSVLWYIFHVPWSLNLHLASLRVSLVTAVSAGNPQHQSSSIWFSIHQLESFHLSAWSSRFPLLQKPIHPRLVLVLSPAIHLSLETDGIQVKYRSNEIHRPSLNCSWNLGLSFSSFVALFRPCKYGRSCQPWALTSCTANPTSLGKNKRQNIERLVVHCLPFPTAVGGSPISFFTSR